MKFDLQTQDINEYLTSSDVINFDHPDIQKLARELSQGRRDKVGIAESIFRYVRDKISHSGDIDHPSVTCKASDVLSNHHGICCAKAHLFAALARSNGIPTGFCYQKLLRDDNMPDSGFGFHGLNAIYLESENRWIRLDARGNKEGVNAEFSINEEKIAWPVRVELKEIDYPVIYSKPLEQVIQILRESSTRKEAQNRWPSLLEVINHH